MKRWLVLVACGHPAPAPERPLHVQHVHADAAVDADDGPCGYLAQELATYRDNMKAYTDTCGADPMGCGPDYPGEPTCEDLPIPIEDVAPPWESLREVCSTHDSIYGDHDCAVTVQTKTATAEVYSGSYERMHLPEITRARAVELVAGDPPVVLVEYHLENRDGTDDVVACTAEPLACRQPIATSGIDDRGNLWTTTVRVDAGHLVLDAATGNPPAGVVGPHAL